jgi:hypothetical protein
MRHTGERDERALAGGPSGRSIGHQPGSSEPPSPSGRANLTKITTPPASLASRRVRPHERSAPANPGCQRSRTGRRTAARSAPSLVPTGRAGSPCSRSASSDSISSDRRPQASRLLAELRDRRAIVCPRNKPLNQVHRPRIRAQPCPQRSSRSPHNDAASARLSGGGGIGTLDEPAAASAVRCVGQEADERLVPGLFFLGWWCHRVTWLEHNPDVGR